MPGGYLQFGCMGEGRKRERNTNTCEPNCLVYTGSASKHTPSILLKLQCPRFHLFSGISYILKHSPKDLLRHCHMLEPPRPQVSDTRLRLYCLTLEHFNSVTVHLKIHISSPSQYRNVSYNQISPRTHVYTYTNIYMPAYIHTHTSHRNKDQTSG